MSKIFGENLRRLREQAGYKQAKEFAAVVGVPYTTYSSYEKLGREPRYEVLCKIAEALSVSIDELLGYNTPSEERDLFAECKTLIESIGMDGEPLLVSKTRHLDEKEYPGIVIQRGGELGYPFARFSSRAEFIAFVQGIMHDFEQSGIYLNARQQFVENALRKEEQRQAEARRKDFEIAVPSLIKEYKHVLQYLQSEEWTPEQAGLAKSLIEPLTVSLRSLEYWATNRPPITSEQVEFYKDLKKASSETLYELHNFKDWATNRPPASQGHPESGHPGDEVAKSHPVEDGAPKQGPTESPTPEAAPPEQEAPKPRRKRQKNSAPSKNETPNK